MKYQWGTSGGHIFTQTDIILHTHFHLEWVVGEWRETRENPFSTFFPRWTFFWPVWPFPAIACLVTSMTMVQKARQSISYHITAVNFYSTIFDHFLPFLTIFDHFWPFLTIFVIACHFLPFPACLPTTRNARKSMAAIVGTNLPQMTWRDEVLLPKVKVNSPVPTSHSVGNARMPVCASCRPRSIVCCLCTSWVSWSAPLWWYLRPGCWCVWSCLQLLHLPSSLP